MAVQVTRRLEPRQERVVTPLLLGQPAMEAGLAHFTECIPAVGLGAVAAAQSEPEQVDQEIKATKGVMEGQTAAVAAVGSVVPALTRATPALALLGVRTIILPAARALITLTAVEPPQHNTAVVAVGQAIKDMPPQGTQALLSCVINIEDMK